MKYKYSRKYIEQKIAKIELPWDSKHGNFGLGSALAVVLYDLMAKKPASEKAPEKEVEFEKPNFFDKNDYPKVKEIEELSWRDECEYENEDIGNKINELIDAVNAINNQLNK